VRSGRGSRRRSAATDQGKSPRETFRPLFEALNWTVSIDAFLREEGEPDDDLRHGLRFARNRVHHQWADALEQRKMYVESSTALIQLTGYSVEWFWKPLHRLPSPPPNRPDRLGSEAYDALLAGREARYALDQLAAWLRERKVDEPS
jgi:hypothetical protein